MFDGFVSGGFWAEVMVRLRRFPVGAGLTSFFWSRSFSVFGALFFEVLVSFEPLVLPGFGVVLFREDPPALGLSFRPGFRGFLFFEFLSGRRLSRLGGGATGRTRTRTWACFFLRPKIDVLGSATTSNSTSSLETESSSSAVSTASATLGPVVTIQSMSSYFRRFLVRPSPDVRLD
jgi:hypothetical protein